MIVVIMFFPNIYGMQNTIATVFLTGIPVKIDTIAVVIAQPALGPSFGVAASGQ